MRPKWPKLASPYVCVCVCVCACVRACVRVCVATTNSFGWHETSAQEVTLGQKLCMNIVFNTSRNIFVRNASLRQFY